MKIFSGFPTGKLQVTPLPDLFFAELCPAIGDLAELKLTLHLMWRLAHRKGSVRGVSLGELRADDTLIQSLAAIDAHPDEALEHALDLATQRGTLLRLPAAAEAREMGDLYFLNSEGGRRAYERAQAGEDRRGSGAPPEPTVVGERPNIFKLYEEHIGLLTPMIAEELKEAEQQYPPEWIQEAFKIAVENNKPRWSYARSILERWKTEGRAGRAKAKPWYGSEYGKFVKR